MNELVVYDSEENPYSLIPTGRSGGEGVLYRDSKNLKNCIKIYYPSIVNKELEEKLRAMIEIPPHDPTYESLGHHSIAWPTHLIYNDKENLKFSGFSMPYVDTNIFFESFNYFNSKDRIKVFGGGLTWKHLFAAAFNLSSVVASIHEVGHLIGDLREKNILMSPLSLITIIDCDSFQVNDNRHQHIYYSRVASSEYLPPELIGIDLKDHDVDRLFGDLFALGVMIFKLLMQGFHPFAARGTGVEDAPSTVQKIKKGYFPYSHKQLEILPPVDAPPYEKLIPPDIQDLFNRCFVDGLNDPKKRPSALEWFTVLKGGIC